MITLIGSESVQLAVDARFKSKDGKLYVTSTRVAFQDEGAEPKAPLKVSVPLSTITSQKQSKGDDPPFQLCLMLPDNAKPIMFTFKTLNDRNETKMKISEGLARLRETQSSGESTPAIALVNPVIAERTEILRKDPELLNLHKTMVGGKIISEEEFWAQRKSASEQSAALPISAGVPSDIMERLQQKSESSDKQVVTLNPVMIESIFRTFPKVKKVYDENVPLKLAPEKFWKEFIEKQLFYVRQGRQPNETIQQLLSQSLVPEQLAAPNASTKAVKGENPLIVIQDEHDDYDGYGQHSVDRAKRRKTGDTTLANHFNQQSTAVLGTCRSNAPALEPGAESRVKEVVDLPDLYFPKPPAIVQLQLTSSTSTSTSTDRHTASIALNSRTKKESVSLSTNSWLPVLTVNETQEVQHHILELYDGAKSALKENELADEKLIKPHHDAIHELLRHIWSALLLPVKRLERVDKLVKGLLERRGKLQDLQSELSGSRPRVMDQLYPMMCAIERAVAQHEIWKQAHE